MLVRIDADPHADAHALAHAYGLDAERLRQGVAELRERGLVAEWPADRPEDRARLLRELARELVPSRHPSPAPV